MKVKEVADKLREAGVPVLACAEWGNSLEGEIKITERLKVQVGGHYCLTMQEGEDDLAIEPLRDRVEDVVLDAKKWA